MKKDFVGGALQTEPGYTNDPTGYTIEVVLWDDDAVRFSA